MDKEKLLFLEMQQRIASNTKLRRKSLGLSQEELSFEAEIDRTYVSQIERCQINPSLLVLCKLSTALSATVEDLILKPHSENS